MFCYGKHETKVDIVSDAEVLMETKMATVSFAEVVQMKQSRDHCGFIFLL